MKPTLNEIIAEMRYLSMISRAASEFCAKITNECYKNYTKPTEVEQRMIEFAFADIAKHIDRMKQLVKLIEGDTNAVR